MTLTDIETSVNGMITGTSLSLPADNSFASESVKALLEAYWTGPLTGTVTPVNGQNGVIDGDHLYYIVTFNTTNFNLYPGQPPVPGKLDFTIVNTNAALAVTVNPAGNYGFTDSFPVLANAPFLTLNQVRMTGVTLVMDSQQQGNVGFQATLTVNDFFELVAWILQPPSSPPPSLAGIIRINQAGGQSFPNVQITTPNLVPLTFGIFNLSVYAGLQSILTNYPGQDPAYTFATFVSLITEFTAGNFTLPVAMGISGPGQTLVSFDLDRSRTIPPVNSLTDLSGFMNTDPKSLITVNLPWNNASFSIDYATVVFDLIGKSLMSFEIDVSFNLAWTIITNVIELQSVGAAFTIFQPTNPKPSNIDVLLYANLKLGPVFLQTSIDLPSGILTASLQEGTTVDINQVIGTFAKGVTLPGTDDLTIYQLDFSAQVTGDISYSFEAGASGQLTIINGLVIDSITFLIDYSNGALSNVRFGSQLTLTACGVDIFLVASWAQTNGWDFSGSTGAGQQIPVGHFIADLISLFHIDGAPDWLNGATVQDISASFNSMSGNFEFGITGTLPMYDNNLVINLTFALTKKPDSNSYTKVITGQITIAGLQFNLGAQLDDSMNAFITTFKPEDGPASIPLKQLVSGISTSLGSAIPDGITVDLTDAKFIYLAQNGPSQFAIGVDLGLSFNLSNLPVIGDKLPADLTIGVNSLQILYCSQPFTTPQVGIVNPMLPSGITPLPATGTGQGVQISGSLNMAGDPMPLVLGATPAAPPTAAPPTAAPTPAPAASPPAAPTPAPPAAAAAPAQPPSITWFNIQKQFGPVQFQRIGIQFSDNVLSFAMDASVTLGPVTFSMQGLTFGSDISEFAPEFDLQGLGLAYTSPEVTIAGSILKVPPSSLDDKLAFQFDGMVSVKAGTWGLAALASYAQFKNGMPSLFVFAELDATLGGPPYFIVTGLMGGFGFNRNLQLPSFDQVMDFPLLAIGANGSSDPMNVLQILEGSKPDNSGKTNQWMQPMAGQYWLAAGISFTSFELLQGKLLLIAEFGQDLQFALLGLAWMTLPQNSTVDNSYVYVELQLAAILKPNEGYFSVGAALTANSFLISKDCHLTGGFAFCFWFGSNPNAGQFVTTIGGYHPAFVPPPYYPKVARLGFNWVVGSEVTIKGGCYFAITPSCGMAGGSLEIMYSSGDLSAWFTAQADIMITWNPFSFLAHISVEIGVSYRLNLLVCHKTITISLGADMTMWGPPTGGRVTIHVVVVSFTVSFGADEPGNLGNDPLVWSDFNALLPAPTDICKVTASTGVFKTLDPTAKPAQPAKPAAAATQSGKIWVVRSGSFSFFTQTAIPANTLSYASGSNTVQAATNGAGIRIRPMNQTGVDSIHLLQLFYEDDSTPQDISSWSIVTGTTNLPETLWGQPLTDGDGNFIQNPPTPSNNLVPNQLTGFTVTVPAPLLGANTGLVTFDVLSEDYIQPANGAIPQNPLSTAVKLTQDFLPAYATGSVSDIASTVNTTAMTSRNSIFSVLNTNAVYSGDNDTMAELAAEAGNLFSDPPMEYS